MAVLLEVRVVVLDLVMAVVVVLEVPLVVLEVRLVVLDLVVAVVVMVALRLVVALFLVVVVVVVDRRRCRCLRLSQHQILGFVLHSRAWLYASMRVSC